MKSKVVLIAAFALFGTMFLSAEVDFAPLNGTNVALTVQPYPPPGENDGSFYVGLTTGFLGSDSSDLFNMFCVDFGGTLPSPLPTSYEATVRALNLVGYLASGGTNELGLTLFQLQTMAVLGQQFGSSLAEDIAIQHDIWSFTSNTFTPDAQVLAAEIAALTTDFSNAYLLDVTSTAPGAGQQSFETIVIGGGNTGTTPTPEPGTLVLLGAGLLSLGFVRRRSRS